MNLRLISVGLLLSVATLGSLGAATLRVDPIGPEIEVRLAAADSTAGTNRFVLEFSDDLHTWTPRYAFESGSYPGVITRLPIEPGARFLRAVPDTSPLPADLTWIPPGRYLMGSPDRESGRRTDEGPQREVRIAFGFWMGRFETTVRDFEDLMGFNPSMSASGSSNPVDNVSWDEAVEFCRRRTEADRSRGRIPDGTAYRLPSEAEWEYACRAGTTTRFSYGDDPDASRQSLYGWNGYNGDNRTHPVGSKIPNPWGLSDIHGNVFEWCLDFYGCYPAGSRDTPQMNHVYRGGSWVCEPNYLRSASRHPGSQVRAGYIGFRVLLGAAPDSVLVSPQAAAPEASLEWSPDATMVIVRALSPTPGSVIRYTTNGSIPGTMHPAAPPILTSAGTVRASAFVECGHRSEPMTIAITQVAPPELTTALGSLEWPQPPPGASLEIASPAGAWAPVIPPVALAEHGSIRARARSPGQLTSPPVMINW